MKVKSIDDRMDEVILARAAKAHEEFLCEKHGVDKLITAEDVVEDNMISYGLYTHGTKISSVIDGLKPINRRILLVQNTTIPRKAVAIVGNVMEKYHPHGDASIANTVTRMAQPFSTLITLMYADSNYGDYGGATQSQPRYLDIAASQFAVDVFFKGINQSTLEYVESESGTEVEPKYFIPKIPMGLLVSAFGMGIAYKSEPANLNMGEVCEMVMQYVKIRSECGNDMNMVDRLNRELSKYVLPDFPIRGLMRNKQQVLDAYVTGDFKKTVISDGFLEIWPNRIVIKTLPFGVKSRKVYKLIGSMLVDKKPNFVNSKFQSVDDFSSGDEEADVPVLLRRGVSPFEVIDDLKKLIRFTGKTTPAYLFLMPDDHLENMSPIGVLETWYLHRERSIRAELRVGQRIAGQKIRKLQALIKIGDNVMEAVKILHDSDSVEQACPLLMNAFDLTKSQALSIMEFKLGNIPKRSHSDLINELNLVKESISDLHNKFYNVPKQITADCKFFIKKYPQYCERRLNDFTFMGYVKTMGGVIQYETNDEMYEIMTRFVRVPVELHRYTTDHKVHFMMSGTNVINESKLLLPKDAKAIRIVGLKEVPKYTIGINTAEGTIFRTNKVQHAEIHGLELEYVGESCVGVTNTGEVLRINPESIPSRSSVKTRGINTDILKVANCDGNTVIVVYSNMVNLITIERVNVGDKIILPPVSIAKTHVLGVFNNDEPFTITVPDHCLNKCSMRHIVVNDTNVLPSNKTVIKLNGKSHDYLSIEKHNTIGVLEI